MNNVKLLRLAVWIFFVLAINFENPEWDDEAKSNDDSCNFSLNEIDIDMKIKIKKYKNKFEICLEFLKNNFFKFSMCTDDFENI